MAEQMYRLLSLSSGRDLLATGLSAAMLQLAPVQKNPAQVVRTVAHLRRLGVARFQSFAQQPSTLTRIDRLAEVLRGVGLDEKGVGRVIKKSNVLQSKNPASVCEYLATKVPIPFIASMVERYPAILGYSVPDNVEPTVEVLSSLVGEQKPKTVVRNGAEATLDQPWPLIVSNPTILNLSHDTLRAKADALSSLGVPDVGFVLCRNPSLLAMSIADNILPKVQFLKDLGVDIPRVLTLHPSVLTLSLTENLRPTVAFLRESGLDPTVVVPRSPAILGLSVERNLRPTMAFLKESGLDPTVVLSRYPSLLGLTQENMRPKFAFLSEMGVTLAQIQAFPTVLTYSLENRLRPRLERARRTGAYIRADGSPYLSQILIPSAADFEAKMAKRERELGWVSKEGGSLRGRQ